MWLVVGLLSLFFKFFMNIVLNIVFDFESWCYHINIRFVLMSLSLFWTT